MRESPHPIEPLGHHAEIRVSNVDKKVTPGQRTVRLCNYMDVYTTRYLDGARRYMLATADDGEVFRFQLQPGDVVITKDSETPDDIGVAAVIEDVSGDHPLVCGYHLAILRPTSVDPLFLAKQLGHDRIKSYFGKVATGSTRYGLSNGAIRGVPLLTPPLAQQKRVGVILRTIDEVIRWTEQVIAKLEHIKHGLLHDLLTRGIDDNGELREPGRHPEQFKDSEVGRIPRAAQIYPLGEAWAEATDGPFGSHLKSSHYVPSGVRVVRLQNIGNGTFVDEDRAFVSSAHAATLRRHQVRAGDLLVASLGDESHPFARACLFPAGLGDAINKADCFRLRMREEVALNAYVALLLTCPFTRRGLGALAQGVTRDRVNLGALSRFRVPLPPIREQTAAIERFGTLVSRVEHEAASLAKLRLLQKGLSDGLLAGCGVVGLLEAGS